MRLLEIDATGDTRRWDEWYAALEQPDIHFSSAYARIQSLHRPAGEIMWRLLLSDDGDIGMPVAVRDTGAMCGPEHVHDMTSMYGYGGPLTIGEMPSPRAFEFIDAVRDWAKSIGIISEYCRLHPMLYENQVPLLSPCTPIEWSKDVVAMDLRDMQLSRRADRAIVRALKAGAMFRECTPSLFAALYADSIERISADERFRFSAEYITEHGSQVGARWFFVDRDIDPAGMRSLLTIGDPRGGIAYAHLLGSDGLAADDGLDTYLYVQAAQRLREEGYTYFHLGGGGPAGDSLLRFKCALGKLYYKVGTYIRVFDLQRYDDLTRENAYREIKEHGRTSHVDDWFPIYRRPFK